MTGKEIKPREKKPVDKNPKEQTKIAVTVNLAELKPLYDTWFEKGRQLGFNEGITWFVGIAEDKLAESVGLSNRLDFCKNGDLLPTWWMVTLIDVLTSRENMEITK